MKRLVSTRHTGGDRGGGGACKHARAFEIGAIAVNGGEIFISARVNISASGRSQCNLNVHI